MLKWLPRLIAVFVLLVVLSVGALAFMLPRLVNREEFRATLHASAAAAIGTPVEWERLDARLFPLRLEIESPILVSEQTYREDARLTAEAIDLRLSLMALLSRRVQVDSVVLRGVELVVTRTNEGLVLPLSAAEEPEPGVTSSPPEPLPVTPPEASGDSVDEDAFEVALRRLVIEDSRVIVHDRTLSPPAEWRLEGLSLEARGDSLDDPLDVDLSTRLASAERPMGALRIVGTASVAGLFDLDVELEEVLLDELQPYLTDLRLSGLLSGTVAAEGATDQLVEVETALTVERFAFDGFGLDLDGGLEVEAQRSGEEPIALEIALDLGEGGKAVARGTATPEGDIDARVELEALEIAPFVLLADETLEARGRATGRVDLAYGATAGLSKLTTDLRVAEARYASGAAAVAGQLDLVLGLEGLAETDPIRFDVGLDLETGGRVDAEGVATQAGSVDTRVVLAGVDLGAVAPWLPDQTQLGGILSGDLDLGLAADRTVERLKTRLAISNAKLVADPVDLGGRFDLDATLEDEGPIRLAAGLVLDGGSQLQVEGTSTVEGAVDVTAKLERFDLAIARPFLPEPEMKLAGFASGTGRLVGEPASPEFLSLDVGIEEGAFETEEYGVEGPFLAVVKVKDPLTRPRGKIELDLTAARLRYLDQFEKRAGMRAEMVTRFVPEKDSGDVIFESSLKLRDIDEILLQGAIGETISVALTTSMINLKGWEEVFPVLAPYEVDGSLAFEGIGTTLVEGSPEEFGGRIAMRGIGLTIPDSGRLRLRGAILGEGKRIRTKGLKALVGGATIGFKGTVEDPLGEGRFDLSIESHGDSEVNDLVSEFTSVKDTVFGPLDLNGELRGLAGGTGSVYDTLDGRFRFTIGEGKGGRLRGVSILRAILDQIPLVGGAARLTQPFRGGRSVDDYFTEEFEVIEGEFVIGGGRVDAKTLRLSYPGYEARLEGPVRLATLEADMTGEVLLKGDLVSAIAGLGGRAQADREPIRIPLARVTGTLDAPEITMTSETLAAVPKLLFQATGLDTLTLGVGRALERALGGN